MTEEIPTEMQRSYEVEYFDPSTEIGDRYDVSFELSEDAEQALFDTFAYEMTDTISDGRVDDQAMHLFRRLVGQMEKHPPWIDVEHDNRVYDLTLTSSDYSILTEMIGTALESVLSPSGAEAQETLVEAWMDINEQMRRQDQYDEEYESADPINGHFDGYVGDGQFARFVNNDTGDDWYTCTDCQRTFPYANEEHDCA